MTHRTTIARLISAVVLTIVSLAAQAQPTTTDPQAPAVSVREELARLRAETKALREQARDLQAQAQIAKARQAHAKAAEKLAKLRAATGR